MDSIWTLSCQIPGRKSLDHDLETEVAIIGAGLAGILTAYKLKEKGIDSIVLEGGNIASGQTKNTTAKITSQHGYIYADLIKDFGFEKAGQFAHTNQKAISEYAGIIQAEKIDCDFETLPSYLYSTSDDEPLIKEDEAAKKLGIPSSFTTTVALPFPVKGAVCFEGQAQFNPLKFIKAISESMTIFENTQVITVEDNLIKTASNTVRAKHIVFATHYPFINMPGYYFLRLHQERSYVLALKNTQQLDGMYYSMDKKGYSLRNYKDLLLFGGESHRTGENSTGGRYNALRRAARQIYPQLQETKCWSAQDCITMDDVPYIGRYSAGTPNWYVATGFRKWGMTSSMVSAMIISDMIAGVENPDAEIYSPQRFNMASVPNVLKDTGQAVKGLVLKRVAVSKAVLDDLPKGHGGIVETEQGSAGVYKDEQGKTYTVSPTCTHLGCRLEWNPDEKSWDCPCHGSRFDYKGNLLDNPAQTDI